MTKFRKLPVLVDAIEWDGTDKALAAIIGLGPQKIERQGNWLDIFTLEGVMRASLGDWIIRGVAGEIYPCKPDIFAATYKAI